MKNVLIQNFWAPLLFAAASAAFSFALPFWVAFAIEDGCFEFFEL
jgi:hypothetical protein